MFNFALSLSLSVGNVVSRVCTMSSEDSPSPGPGSVAQWGLEILVHCMQHHTSPDSELQYSKGLVHDNYVYSCYCTGQ